MIGLFAELVNKLIPLILVRFGGQRLGLDGYGFSQYGMFLIDILTPWIAFGYSLNSMMLAKQAIGGNHATVVQRLVGEALALRACHYVLVVIGLAGYLGVYQGDWLLFLILAAALLVNVLELSFVNFTIQRLHLLSWATILGKLVNLAVVLVWVHEGTDAYLFLAAALSANAVVGLLSFAYGAWRFPPIWPTPKRWAQAAWQALPYGLFMVTAAFCDRLDFVIIESHLGLAALGLYGGVYKIYLAALPIVVMVINIFFAESLAENDGQRERRLLQVTIASTMLILYPLAFGSYFVATDLVVFLIGADFAPGAEVLPVLFAVLCCAGLGLVLVQQVYLRPARITKLAIYTVLWSPLAWLAFDFAVPYGLKGVAAAMLFYKAGFLLPLVILGQKWGYRILGPLTTGLLPACLMAVGLWLVGDAFSLWGKIFAGGAVYAAAVFFWHPTALKALLRQKKSR